MNTRQAASLVQQQENAKGDGHLDVLAFQVGSQIYTLEIGKIYQIIDMVALTQFPGGKDTFEGIFNYHGSTVPVVDLRKFLGLPKQPVNLHTPIILAAYSGQTLGMIVDRVHGVVSCPKHSIFLPKDFLPEGLGEVSILDGVIQSSENYLLLLNLEQLFSQPNRQDLGRALQGLTLPSQDGAEHKTPAKSSEVMPAHGRSGAEIAEKKNAADQARIDQKPNQKQRKQSAAGAKSDKGPNHRNSSSNEREKTA